MAHPMTNSHLLVQEFDYFEPATLDETISLLTDHGDHAQVLAGGTYLLVQMKMEHLEADCVISIGHIPALSGIVHRDADLQVGPLTTIRMIRNTPHIRAEYTALAEACAAFGSTQIQMMGTIGGNVCSGSPASDTVPPLMALDAKLVLVGPKGERILPVEDFLIGPGKTALEPGELLASIMLPSLTYHASRVTTGSAFVKISRVGADLAKASVAAVLTREAERIVDCRLVFGSLGPTVLRARKAESTLIGQTFDAKLALDAGDVASWEVSPIDDVRSTAWYRRGVVKALTHDVLHLAWKRAEEHKRHKDSNTQHQGTGHSPSPTSTLGHHASRCTPHEIELTVNGVGHRLLVKPNELLLNVLRERLHLTGTKYGCGIGECGACTVLLNGKPALSCLVLAVSTDGSHVLTAEGLQSPGGELDPLQEAFIDHAAFQCGYCTPGMLMMTKSLLEEMPSPTEDDVRDYLKGNRCRCTGFASIVRAVMSCSAQNQEKGG